MTKNNSTWTYTYNSDGLRTSRTNGVTTYDYVYSGDLLKQMTVTDVASGAKQILTFTYDATGTPLTLDLDGTVYYYLTNIQGDVTGIVDSTGNLLIQYVYEGYGKSYFINDTSDLTVTLGSINPLAYRAYVFDMGTALYYLQSRYYDQFLGRFLNADTLVSNGQGLLGNNMFSYCNNNPVMYTDSLGMAPEWWQWAISGVMVVAGIALVATGVGGVAGGALICAGANSMIGSYVSEATGGSSVAGWAGGMITGAVCGTGAGFTGTLLVQATKATGVACLGNLVAGGAVAFTSGAAGSAIGQGVSAAIDGKKLNSKEVVCSSITTGAINCLSGLGAGIGAALQGTPAIGTTTTTLANSLNAAWSLVSESVCDFLGTISSLLSW